MRFFITGINGFIGSNIARRLIIDGHQVAGLVRNSSDLKFLSDISVELHFGDITKIETLYDAIKNTDNLIHVAALASDWGNYNKFYAINFEGTKNVYKAAIKNGVKNFVYISSTTVHGFQKQRYINENHPLPYSKFHYCETKKLAENWLFENSDKNKIHITAIRAGNVFGEYDHTFIEKYLEALISGKIALIDKGKHWTCPVYISNLIDGIMLACFNPKANGEAFLITDGLEISWKEFTNQFADEMKIKRPTLSFPFWFVYAISYCFENIYKLFHISKPPLLTRYRAMNGGTEFHFSIEKAKNILDYSPSVPFQEAVKRTVKWFNIRNK